MSLKSKIEAVIYASEEPVTLQQLVSLLAGEAQAELDEIASGQGSLQLDQDAAEADASGASLSLRGTVEAGMRETADAEPARDADSPEQRAVDQGEVAEASGEPEPSGEESAAQPGTRSGSTEPQTSASEGAESAGTVNEPSNAGPPASDAAVSEPQAATGGSDTSPAEATTEDEKRRARDRERAVREHLRRTVDALIREYAESDRGIEIREVASGFRMGSKPEYHDAVRGFVKSLKPALKLTLPALETLAVVAYKQPVTAAEISEIRGVDSAGVLGGLMTRKLIATAGRKQVIGRPMLYKTTRDFLLRFGLKDVNELPSMEEFERMAGELAEQEDLPMDGADAIIEKANARGDAEMIRDANAAGDANAIGDAAPETEADGTGQAEIAPLDPNETTQPNATAESAAGGTHEEADEQPTADVDTAEPDTEHAGIEEAQQQTEEEHAR